jgi:ribose-phosphate pyrophosphokinase
MPLTISDNMGTPVRASHLRFAGGERHVQLYLAGTAANSSYTVRARIHSSDDVFDLLLTCDALRNASNCTVLNLEIPYLPYARQDRVCAPGQAFSLDVFAKLLTAQVCANRLVVWDCHSDVGIALTGAQNVAANKIAETCRALKRLFAAPQIALVCPDKGARARTEAMANAMGVQDVVYCEKVRDPSTGRIRESKVLAEDLSGLTAVITDDICDGGRTFIEVARRLRELGATRVVLFVTHGLFSQGIGVFDGIIDHIYTTDSFPQRDDPRLTVIPFEFDFHEGQ